MENVNLKNQNTKLMKLLLAIILIAMVWIGNISLIVITRLFGADFLISTIISIIVTTPPAIITTNVIWEHYR